MKIGVDLGYSAVKAHAGGQPVSFPSIVGTPDRARFAVNGTIKNIILAPDGKEKRLVGAAASLQSRFAARREDRGWIESDEYLYLMATAFTELTEATRVKLRIVTGLPVAFISDKDAVRDRFLGSHKIDREGRKAQSFTVEECRVIPQPFGTVLSEALSPGGKILKNDLATGDVGIIDIGGKTTNILSIHRLAEIGRETTSVSLGAWDIMRKIRQDLDSDFPGLDYRDHQVVEAIKIRQVKYFGEIKDLSPEIDQTLRAMADQVLAEASQLWNNGARLDAILITGGGALLLGDYITGHFPHARVVDDPVHANAIGYYKFSQRL